MQEETKVFSDPRARGGREHGVCQAARFEIFLGFMGRRDCGPFFDWAEFEEMLETSALTEGPWRTFCAG